MAAHPRGAVLNGTVREVDAKGAVVDLADGIEGYLSARDFSKDRIDDLSQHLKAGEQVEAKFIGMDRKGRMLQLSIRAKDEDEMAETLSEYQNQHADRSTTKLGALLKEQLNKSE
jgi:small subunit ribosomal protein S1